VFDLRMESVQALFYQPSYERLRERISHAAPDLDIVLIDEDGKLSHHGQPVSPEQVNPQWFWIHSELFKTPVFPEYFRLMQEVFNDVQWLHTINTGLDQGPYLALLRQGVRISNNHSQAIAIAEYVMAHVLSHFHDLPAFAGNQAAGNWKYLRFRELCRTRWVIVGFGHIGQQVARRAKAFGVHVTAVRRSKGDADLADAVCQSDTMGEALQAADVVVLACASNEATRDMVDACFLAQMKDGAVLVNIARGDLVVEEDLKAALDAGRPGHAILDVFREEPLPADAWFWFHPRVTLTPHCSNGGSGMRNRSDDLFLENLNRMSSGQRLLNAVSEKDIL